MCVLQVSFTLRNDVTKLILLQTTDYADEGDALKHHCKTTKNHSLVSITVEKAPFKLISKISRQTETNHHFQIIFVNKRLVKSKVLYKTVNKELEKSLYLNNTRNKDKLLQIEKCYPVYVINITCPHCEYDISSDPKKLQVEFRDWDVVTECLLETVAKFLLTEPQLNEITLPLSECNNRKYEEQERKECDYYQAKTKAVYTTVVKRNTTQQISLKSTTNQPRCKLKAKQKHKQTGAKRLSSLVNETPIKADGNCVSLETAETVPRMIATKNIPANKKKELCSPDSKISSKAQSVININNIENMSLVEYPLKSCSEHSFSFKMPNKLPLKRKLTEHILTESETDNSPVTQKMARRLVFLDEQVENAVCSTETSILPIISQEFLNENLNNLTLSRNAVLNISTKELNITPNQAIQIDFYRSVKKHSKSNDLKVTHKQNVKFIDFDQGSILDCRKNIQSSIELNNKLSSIMTTTINQTRFLDNLQELKENISTSFSDEVNDKIVQTQYKRNMSLEEKQNGNVNVIKEVTARNHFNKPVVKRFKSLHTERGTNRRKPNALHQSGVKFLNSANLCEPNKNLHPQSLSNMLNLNDTTNLNNCSNATIKYKLSEQQFTSNCYNGPENEEWEAIVNSPLYPNYKPVSFLKALYNMNSLPEENSLSQFECFNRDKKMNLNPKSKNLMQEEHNRENRLITTICAQFRELSMKDKSMKSKHFPTYAGNNERHDFAQRKDTDFVQSRLLEVLDGNTSKHFTSIHLNSVLNLPSNHQKYMIPSINPESSTTTLTSVNPYKLKPTFSFDKITFDYTLNRQICNDNVQCFSPTLEQVCFTERNRAVANIFNPKDMPSFQEFSMDGQTTTCNDHENEQLNTSNNKTNSCAIDDANNQNREHINGNTIHWNEVNTPHGQTIFINSISGMSSFKKPGIQNNETMPVKLQSRHWFMPKGISPLITMTVSGGENIAELTSSEKDIMETIIQPICSVDLATVKWKTSQCNSKFYILLIV